MSLNHHKEIFINNKNAEIIERGGYDNIAIYLDFYQFSNKNLNEIFSVIHRNLNFLFQQMNQRLKNRYYTANESRELLYYIDEIKKLQANLKGTSCDFEIIDSYKGKLSQCASFLQNSNGSAIPNDFEKIEIIEAEPVFFPVNQIKVRRGTNIEAFSLQIIGSGSYAIVYKYMDKYYNRQFALKRANKDLNEKERQRFKNEFDVMKRLNSPYVIEVYTYDDDKHQYIMEFADSTLESYINENNNKLKFPERIILARQIIKAFCYINSKTILHRDISPKNVLLKKYDELVVVKISDFGLVKQLDSIMTSANTKIKGAFNDPQLNVIGFNRYSIIHETYALTRLIYFVMTGKTIIDKSSTSSRTSSLTQFIEKGLSVNDSQRYGSVEELGSAFEEVIISLKNCARE